MPQQMLWNVGFLCITYVPLQILALWRCRGVRRVSAALPLPPMLLMIGAALQATSYRDGSLGFLMLYIFFYFPSMIWLGAVLVDPRRPFTCPHCGKQVPVKSFQFMRSKGPCLQCGKSFASGHAELSHPPEPAAGSVSNQESSPPAR